jgi:hypothetical protein
MAGSRKTQACILIKTKDRSCVSEKCFTRGSELDGSRAAHEKRVSGLRLQAMYLRAHRGLGGIEHFGRVRESSAFRDGNETSEQLRIKHRRNPFTI